MAATPWKPGAGTGQNLNVNWLQLSHGIDAVETGGHHTARPGRWRAQPTPAARVKDGTTRD
jgi:hypothetical protein